MKISKGKPKLFIMTKKDEKRWNKEFNFEGENEAIASKGDYGNALKNKETLSDEGDKE